MGALNLIHTVDVVQVVWLGSPNRRVLMVASVQWLYYTVVPCGWDNWTTYS